MGYRKHSFTPGGVYHIYNRGVEKRDIFLSDSDRIRFRALLLHCLPVGRNPSYSLLKNPERQKQRGKKLVDVLCYCLMPNHFHLLLKETEDKGVSTYMQRFMNSYVRYFNTKQQRSGPLFAGPFRSVPITGDDQLLHVSRYIHLNPYVASLSDDPFTYAWSSLNEYVSSPKYRFCQIDLIKHMLKPAQHRKFITDYADYARELGDIKHLLHDDES